MPVPSLRIRAPHDLALRSERPLVVYWMIGARRTTYNHALDRALELCAHLEKPLLVIEPLRAGYRWVSERFQDFVRAGMRDNDEAFARAHIAYHAYVEPHDGAGRGMLAALARHAAVIVTDEALGFFQPRMIDAAAHVLDTRLEVVDSNGILPLRSLDRALPMAQAFRRHVQREVRAHLDGAPRAAALAHAPRVARGAEVPRNVSERWPFASLSLSTATSTSTPFEGGANAAQAQLAHFITHGLARYAENRSDPDVDAQSSLSPWLHFGHIGAHEIFAAIARAQQWSPAHVVPNVTGAREGFWGMDRNAEAFLDELVVWRELAHNGAMFLDGFDSFDGTPAWAQATLAAHEHDKRAHLYTLDELEHARTHDDVWNAAQRQLVTTGAMHNALRMLWGKNVLTWTRNAREAFDILVHLNNKYAIDGRDPNSYAGIGWVFGRYDRPWPERAVFGTVRCMTTASSRKKWHMRAYLERFGVGGARLTMPSHPMERAACPLRRGHEPGTDRAGLAPASLGTSPSAPSLARRSLFARAPAHALTER